jgi:hypothetical protein
MVEQQQYIQSKSLPRWLSKIFTHIQKAMITSSPSFTVHNHLLTLFIIKKNSGVDLGLLNNL